MKRRLDYEPRHDDKSERRPFFPKDRQIWFDLLGYVIFAAVLAWMWRLGYVSR
jgi:hypothetical protein